MEPCGFESKYYPVLFLSVLEEEAGGAGATGNTAHSIITVQMYFLF